MQDTWIDAALDSLATRMRAAGRMPLGYRPNGRPIWPIFGASEPPPAPPAPQPPAPTPPPAPQPPAETGFPANTPLEQMNADQREAYWRFHARKHEERVKSLGSLTAEQLQELQTKAARADQLEYDLKSDTDKKVEDAKREAREAAIAEATPEVIMFALDAAAARAGVSAEDLASATQFVDDKKFLKPDGKVDPDKVKTFVQSIKPARGDSKTPTRLGPSSGGTGNHQQPSSGSAADKGRAEAQKRFGTQTKSA